MNTKWEETFDELTIIPDELDYYGTKQWLKTRKTLYKDEVYPESIVELDHEKLKAFIKDQITEAGKDSLRSLMPEIEGMKKGLGTHSGVYRDAYLEALERVIKLIQSRTSETRTELAQQAQQEIAEQIISQIYDYTDCVCSTKICQNHFGLKDRLRKKYIK